MKLLVCGTKLFGILRRLMIVVRDQIKFLKVTKEKYDEARKQRHFHHNKFKQLQKEVKQYEKEMMSLIDLL